MKTWKRWLRNKNRGQTALEYALVIGVISVGIIITGRALFGSKDSVAEGVMRDALNEARESITDPGNP